MEFREAKRQIQISNRAADLFVRCWKVILQKKINIEFI